MMAIGKKGPTVPNYFYVQDESGLGGEIWFPGRNTPAINLIECSTDLETWTSYSNISTTTRITLPAGGRVYMRGENSHMATSTGSWRWLQCDALHSVGGRLEYLLEKTGNPETIDNFTFVSFFGFYNADNTTLIDASKLTLKILGTATEFYRAMFRRCTALVKGPFVDMQGQSAFGLCCLFCSLPYILLHEKEPVQEAGIKVTAFCNCLRSFLRERGDYGKNRRKG